MKRIMNKWLWSLLCVTLLGAAACSDDDTEGDSGNPIPPALSTENLPDAGLKFLYSALTPHTFTMNVDAPWEITKTAGWFVVTPNKGEAGQNIQVTVTPTLNQGEARDGEFTIRANSGNNLHPCLTEKSIPLSQDAYLAAGIVITGLDERLLAFEAEDTDPVVFTVEASYDWTLTVENETWLTVAPKSGKAGSAAQVTITPKANTTDERRESKITITAGDAEFGENTAEEIIELVQAPYMPKDTHTEGYVFFSDDFQWIPDNWVSPYTKYGWPSVSIDGTNGNEFALSTDGMKEAVAAKGYTYTPSVYA
ncbi:BACON domain-containing protein, partial [Alistipes onderdonkii]